MEALWPLVTIGGPIALGLVIAYLMVVTRRRRLDLAARARSNAATDKLYKEEDHGIGDAELQAKSIIGMSPLSCSHCHCARHRNRALESLE